MARDFDDAGSNVISFGATTILDDATSCTISGIITLDDLTAEHKIAGEWGGAGNDSSWLLTVPTDGKLGFAFRDQANADSIYGKRIATGLSSGTEYQFVFVWNGTTNMTVYINGSSVSVEDWISGANRDSINSSTTNFKIGAVDDGGYFDGRISEFAIWKNRALGAGEANSLGKRFSPLHYPQNLVFYSTLVGKNSPEIDIIQGKSGTVTGATAFSHPRIIYPTGGL